MTEGLSIVITAYQSHLFIHDCIASVYSSISLFEEPWELLIGIDGCPDTRRAVLACPLRAKTSVYYFPTNVGTYVVTNTMMYMAAYDCIVRFDSDDIMLPAFSQYLANRRPARTIMQFPYRNFTQPPHGERSVQDTGKVSYSCGIVCMAPGVLDELGGYRPWRCAADADLLYRAGLANLPVHRPIPEFGPAMLRRRHENSVSAQKTTGIFSEVRNRYWALTRENADPYVEPTTAPHLRIV